MQTVPSCIPDRTPPSARLVTCQRCRGRVQWATTHLHPKATSVEHRVCDDIAACFERFQVRYPKAYVFNPETKIWERAVRP